MFILGRIDSYKPIRLYIHKMDDCWFFETVSEFFNWERYPLLTVLVIKYLVFNIYKIIHTGREIDCS